MLDLFARKNEKIEKQSRMAKWIFLTKLRPLNGSTGEVRSPFIDLEPYVSGSIPVGWISRSFCHVDQHGSNVTDAIRERESNLDPVSVSSCNLLGSLCMYVLPSQH